VYRQSERRSCVEFGFTGSRMWQRRESSDRNKQESGCKSNQKMICCLSIVFSSNWLIVDWLLAHALSGNFPISPAPSLIEGAFHHSQPLNVVLNHRADKGCHDHVLKITILFQSLPSLRNNFHQYCFFARISEYSS